MKRKKYLSMLLVFVMIFSLTEGMQTTWGASPESDFGFDLSTGTITGYSGSGGAIEIPLTIEGVPVTAIGDYAFYGRLTSVTTPSSITISSSVLTIGDNAFSNCTALEQITLPDSITSLGTDVFNGCSKLSSVVLPSNITTIPNQSFLGCSKLTHINIPNNVKTMGSYAFGNCSELTDVTMSTNMEVIDYCAFLGCTSLKSMTFPSTIKTIGSGLFGDCSALETIYFEGNIPDGSGTYCSGTANWKVYYKSEYTTTSYIFNKQPIPLSRINMGAFTDGNISMGTVDGITMDSVWVAADATVNLNILPDAGKQLKGGSLKYNDGSDHLITGTSFIMPANEVTISAEFMPAAATTYSISVGTLTGGSITTDQANAAPDEIINLTISPVLGNQLKEGTLKYTANGADYPINGTSFVMPTGNVSIEAEFETTDYVFDATTGTITDYSGSGTAIEIPSIINSVSVIAIGSETFKDCTTLTSVIIPSGIKSIGADAFSGCSQMTEITIPDGVISIGGNAFDSCFRLKSIKLPDSVTSMDGNIFYNCFDLASVNIPKGITEIPSNTFAYCFALTSVTIPDNINGIDLRAFYECNKLESVIFKGNAPTSIGSLAFFNVSANFKVLFKFGSAGFTEPLWNGYPSESYSPAVTFTVAYDGNGNVSGSAPAAEGGLSTGDSIVVLGNTGSLAKTGCEFDSWNTKADGTGTKYNPGDIVTIGLENVTLFAQWSQTYIINKNTMLHGSISIQVNGKEAAIAEEKDAITVTVTPDSGYRYIRGSLLYKYSNGGTDYYREIDSLDNKRSIGKPIDSNEFYFVMPKGNVTIKAEFELATNDYSSIEFEGSSIITKYYGAGGNIIIPAKINNVPVYGIAPYAFWGCNKLTGVTIPEGIIVIAPDAFGYCEALSSVSLPDSLISINDRTFASCTSLKTIRIPKQVTILEGRAFLGCSNLAVVCFEGDAPSELGKGIFQEMDPNLTIYYKTGAKGFDQAPWTDYSLKEYKYLIKYKDNNAVSGSVPAEDIVFAGNSIQVKSNSSGLTKTGYTFAGWNTKVDGTGTNYAVGATINEANMTDDMILYAKWTVVISGGGGGSAGAATPGAVTPAPVLGNVPVVAVKSDGNGKAVAAFTDKQITDTMKDVTAGKQIEEKIIKIRVEAPKDVKSVETSIPKAAMTTVVKSEVMGLTVSTPVADLTFDKKALKAIDDAATGDVKITAEKLEAANLSKETKQLVGDRPVYNFSVTSGGNTISQFGGNVTVAVPYTPNAGEDINAIVIYFINAAGELEIVSNCAYDPTTGTVSFTTNHFSKFTVGYNKVTFKDVAADAGYSEAVNFIAARGITSGTGDGYFNPEASITRGQFIVMLMNAYDIKPNENLDDNFADAGNTDYTNYLAAAKRLGLANGIGNNLYAPDQEITQQEMICLLYKTLKVIGDLPRGTKGKDLTAYTDASQIAPWATEAMTLFVKAGIITGRDNKLIPTENVNRAQMAQVLYNMLSK